MSHDQNHPGHNLEHNTVPFTMHQQVRVGENTAYPHYKGAYASFLNVRPTGLARIALHNTWTQNKYDVPIEVPLQCLEAIRCDCHLEINEEAQVPLAAILYHSLTGEASYLAPALKRGERGLFCCMPCFVSLEQSRLERLSLSHMTMEPMKAQDYHHHPFCSHCTVLASWRVQGKSPTGTIFLSLSVCVDDIVRYQPEKWCSWAWEVEHEGYLFRGPCTAYTLETAATSTLSLEVRDPHGLPQTLTVPWHQARPFAPVASALWRAFSAEDEADDEREE